MEILDQIQDLLVNHWDKLLLYFSMLPIGLTTWKIGSIFIKLIQNWTAKKYTKKQKEYSDKVLAEINNIKGFISNTIKEEVKLYVGEIKKTFNNLQQKTLEAKEKVYQEIFETKMNVQEIVEEIKQDAIEEVKAIEQEVEQKQQELQEEPQEIIQEEIIEVAEEPKKVDLL